MTLTVDDRRLPTVATAAFGASLQGYQDSTLGPHQVMIYPAILRTLAPHVDGALICEVGCGDGRIVDLLARAYGDRYRSLTAVDINEVQRQAARRLLQVQKETYPRGKVRANVLQGDVLDLHFADDEFDVLVCSMVLVHFPLPELRRALAEMSRVTRAGGRAMFVVTSLPWCRLQYALDELEWPGEPGWRYWRYVRGHDGQSWNQYACQARDYEALLAEAGWRLCAPREELTIPPDPHLAERYRRHAGLPLFWVFHVQKP